MAMLHIIRSSGFSNNALELCIGNLQQGDSLALLDDGCYNLNHKNLSTLAQQLGHENIYVINEHVKSRALNTPKSIKTISLAQLSELIFTHDNNITWS